MNSKQPSTLSSDIERNPKKHVKAVILKSGKQLNELESRKKQDKKKILRKEYGEETQKKIK